MFLLEAPPYPPTVKVLKTTASTVDLSWKPHDDGGPPIKGNSFRLF